MGKIQQQLQQEKLPTSYLTVMSTNNSRITKRYFKRNFNKRKNLEKLVVPRLKSGETKSNCFKICY